jgi:DNA-binding MarR family transcriptional regulator
MATLTESIERLFEPVARAVRRGDLQQLKTARDRLDTIWKSQLKNKSKKSQSEELARGMTFALEAVLGFALGRADADARRTLVDSRKHALPVLHALGLKARKATAHSQRSCSLDRSEFKPHMKLRELADAIGIKPQNIGELIDAMSDVGLVEASDRSTSRLVSISEAGAQTLEASLPGWQLMDVQGALRLDERVEAHWVPTLGKQIEAFAAELVDTPTCVYVYMHGSAPHAHPNAEYPRARTLISKRTEWPESVSSEHWHGARVPALHGVVYVDRLIGGQMIWKSDPVTESAKAETKAVRLTIPYPKPENSQ